MLGLAILFGLAVWCVVTLIATLIGYTIGKKKGMVTGFMLTMGGWLVWWAVEFAYIQAKVSYLCHTEAGTTVYVTPEQWRKQIGEAEWQTLQEDFKNISSNWTVEFNGKKYYGLNQPNRRLINFYARDKNSDGISDYDEIYVDKITNQVLFTQRFFSVGTPAIANSLEGLKFWLDRVDDCGPDNDEDRFFHRNYTNYSIE
ncbi:hypothetical protein [Conchiformibius kuhniae]|uniref:Transglycosylase-associated protein n=1 Tax=Conchiformibius kuhniae TaxID=211502 RepID=A0A8T9MSF7_9NEIS|nr:hypothetical protein [Conchiformibius kuhniae]UOP04159.1 transglycosylase-associated protein [Conchiformibius kuhniae]